MGENVRIHELVKRHTAIFDLLADSSQPGGWLIYMKRGLISAFPEELPPEVDMTGVPDVILDPHTDFEKMQNLRIHIVRLLFKRGGQCVLHDLGQDPAVVEIKKEVLKSMAILHFLRCFPLNFQLTDLGNGNFIAELLPVDCDDLNPVYDCVAGVSAKASK